MKTPKLIPEISRKFLVKPIGDETIILNLCTHECHHLNELITKIFRLCNGRNDSQAMAERTGEKEEMILRVLVQLSEVGLLETPEMNKIERRDFLAGAAKLGLAAPLITTLTVSGTAAAQSPISCIQGALCPTTQASGGGNSGEGPQGCLNCCGTGLDTPPCGAGCPGNCAVCFCLYQYTCSNDGFNPAPCNTTGANICEAGTMDIRNTSGFCEDPSTMGDRFARSCAEAKSNAGTADNYRCCECP